MTYRLAKISSKRFFKNLKNGHKVRPVYEAIEEDDELVYIDETGRHTKAFWDMLRDAKKEIDAYEKKMNLSK